MVHTTSVSNGRAVVRETIGRHRQLADALAERIRPDGSLDDHCGSRILESALLTRLLHRTGRHPEVYARLWSYLAAAAPVHEVERIVQRASWGVPGLKPEAEAFLSTFEHATGSRKKVLLTTVLALLGAHPFGTTDSTATTTRYAIWTDMALCASTVLNDAAQGRVRDSHVRHVTDLLGSASPGKVWQGNVLAHLLGLHALAAVQPCSPDVVEGISAIVRVLNQDGGLPFIVGQDVWVSALAGIALHEAGTTPSSASRVGDFLAETQLADGGWGYLRSTTQSDVDDTSRCVAALHRIDPRRHAEVIRKGRDYLVGIAGADGGFPTYVRGDRSEPDLTAGALIALAPYEPAADTAGRAVDFLLSRQRDNGLWETSWTVSESSVAAHVLRAWEAQPTAGDGRTSRTGAAAARTTACLVSAQNDDGGWAQSPGGPSDVISTAHAVSALARRRPGAAMRGVAYLLSAHDGTRHSCVPDQVGPRPLPYDFPVLADVHVLTAFTEMVRSWGHDR